MPSNYFANAGQENDQPHYIVSLLDPLSGFISNDDNETVTIRDLIDGIIIKLDLLDDLSDIFQETEDRLLMLMGDTVEYVLIHTYDFTSEIMNTPIQKSVIRNFSTSFDKIMNGFAKNVHDDLSEYVVEKFGNSNIKVKQVFDYFKDVQDKRSDENFIVKEIITMLNTTEKYDDYNMIYDGNAYSVKGLKSTLAIMASSLFPSTPYESYFKLSSIMLNGILRIEDVTFDPNESNQTVADMIVNDFKNVFTEGYSLYFAKIIASIMNVYYMVVQKEDDDTLSELKNIIEDNRTLSLKYRDSIRLVYRAYGIKMKAKEFMESIYFIPVRTPSFINDDKLYTYDEIMEKIDMIEKEENTSMENIAMEDLLSSQASQSVNDIIRLNNDIRIQLNDAILKYPDVVTNLIGELNISLASTTLVQIFYFTNSLGSFMMESGKTIASNIVGDSIEQSGTESGKQPKKILCLHGGGEEMTSFQSQQGVQDLMEALPDYEFVFAQSPLEGNIWWQDPQNKQEGTIDVNHASTFLNYMDDFITNNGPFYAILGYSQGGAAVMVYNAYRKPSIEKMIICNGYLPTTHKGLMQTIEENAPSNIDTLIYIGANDKDFRLLGEGITTYKPTLFTSSRQVVGEYTGHYLPIQDQDISFDRIAQFIHSDYDMRVNDGNNGGNGGNDGGEKNDVLGDATNDGEFNAADVVFAASYLAKLEPFVTDAKNDSGFIQRVDVTKDGEINATDVVYMASNLAKVDGYNIDTEPGSD